jgi:hypothetical protein
MGVGINQPGDDHPPGQIHHLGAGTLQREDHGLGSHALDVFAPHRNGFMDREPIIDSDNYAMVQDEVGGRLLGMGEPPNTDTGTNDCRRELAHEEFPNVLAACWQSNSSDIAPAPAA